jgi:hypothetical protein
MRSFPRAKRRPDRVVAKSGQEAVERRLEIARIDTERRQGASWSEYAKGGLERLLPSERLNGNIDSSSIREKPDFLDRIDLREINHVIGPHPARHLHSLGDALDRDDSRGAHQAGSCRGAQPDGPLGEHRHDVSDADASTLGSGEAGRHNVGVHEHLLIGEPIWHEGKVRHGIGHPQVFGLASVDGVAELPAAHRLPAMLGAGPVLRMATA